MEGRLGDQALAFANELVDSNPCRGSKVHFFSEISVDHRLSYGVRAPNDTLARMLVSRLREIKLIRRLDNHNS